MMASAYMLILGIPKIIITVINKEIIHNIAFKDMTIQKTSLIKKEFELFSAIFFVAEILKPKSTNSKINCEKAKAKLKIPKDSTDKVFIKYGKTNKGSK